MSTLGNYMKQHWNLSYKQLESRHAYSKTSENNRKFFGSAAIQYRLLNEGVELIFLDEFSVNPRHMKHREWTIKGHKGYIRMNSEGFSMSFIVALSNKRIYGIMGWRDAVDHSVVRYFISGLLFFWNKSPSSTETPFALIMDNASVHVWNNMTNFYEKSGVWVITIAPYRPSLNISEKLIWAIKKCIHKISGSGR